MNVLPDPVAICARARGRLACIEASTAPMACTWIRRNPSVGTGPRRCRRARSDPAWGSACHWRIQRAIVSGRWNANTDRARGSGSNPSVNMVSSPVASYRNGNGATTDGNSGGSPVAYLADWASTPASGVPDGLASTAPTATPSTNSR